MIAKTHRQRAARRLTRRAGSGGIVSGGGPVRHPATGITLSATDGTIGSLRNPVPVQVKTRYGPVEAVVIALPGFEKLLDHIEDLEARRAYENTRDQESFPLEVAERLIAGHSPVRVFRNYRGLTLDALADAVGLSKGYLSDIENGKKPGSVKTLNRIAAALGVEIGNLVRHHA